jgi:hypothetical protein
MSSRQIDWELLRQLGFQFCGEYMASPIKMCEKGHIICGGCKEFLSDCPNCTAKCINARNFNLEKIAATAVYPCKNREPGCKEIFTVDDRNKHPSV